MTFLYKRSIVIYIILKHAIIIYRPVATITNVRKYKSRLLLIAEQTFFQSTN